jgi:hypothetical protein
MLQVLMLRSHIVQFVLNCGLELIEQSEEQHIWLFAVMMHLQEAFDEIFIRAQFVQTWVCQFFQLMD